jgi:hypothetical protein
MWLAHVLQCRQRNANVGSAAVRVVYELVVLLLHWWRLFLAIMMVMIVMTMLVLMLMFVIL